MIANIAGNQCVELQGMELASAFSDALGSGDSQRFPTFGALMQTRNRNLLSILAFLVGQFLAIASAHANLIVIGGFEDPIVIGPYAHRNGSELTGWTVFSSSRGAVQFNSTLYNPVTEGVQAVQLEWPGDSISQSFATIIGQSYTLTFDLSAYSIYGGPGRRVAPCPCVSVLDVTIGSLSETLNGSSAGYVRETLTIIADSAITTLTFKDDGQPSDEFGNYPQIDNVSVTGPVPTNDVPEPAALALFTVALAGLGIGRRRSCRS